MKTYGEILKEKRESKGLTVRTVAGKIGISVTYLCDIESNHRHFPCKLSRQFIAILKMSKEESQELYDAIARANNDIPLDIKEYLLRNNLLDALRIIINQDEKGESLMELVSSFHQRKR